MTVREQQCENYLELPRAGDSPTLPARHPQLGVVPNDSVLKLLKFPTVEEHVNVQVNGHDFEGSIVTVQEQVDHVRRSPVRQRPSAVPFSDTAPATTGNQIDSLATLCETPSQRQHAQHEAQPVRVRPNL